MRILNLNKGGLNKLRSHSRELKASDVEDSLKSLPPGEWCELRAPGTTEAWTAFVNPLVADHFSSVMILGGRVQGQGPESFIEEKLRAAYARRMIFQGYEEGCRTFYGNSDGLPGLIVDTFSNASLIQINTAGVDRYRDHVRNVVSGLTGRKCFFLDNPKYREKEFLPTFENEIVPHLEVRENGLSYRVRSEVIQKIGFYYDHRENRRALRNLLKRLNLQLKSGIDLFSYAGAWGMSALSGGVDHMVFIDQGDFGVEVAEGLKLNGFEDRGDFERKDVFKFLDEAASLKKSYDVLLCDPPAFAKSVQQKSQALEGYSKLHRRVFKVAGKGSLCAFSSCTHYVEHDDFQKNVLDAAYREGRKIQLIYSGLQGFDHPVSSQADRSNYIKSYFYLVE